MLLLFKPFQVGDYIIQDQSGGTEGTVYKIEMFYTTLTTVDNKHDHSKWQAVQQYYH